MIIRSLSCVALFTAISGLLLAGCGGGGGSTSPVSPVTVTDSSSSFDVAASRAFAPNYSPAVQNDGTWSSHSLSVYVPSAGDYTIADAAMRRWEEATDNYFQFTRVATAEGAQITFQRVSSDNFEAGVVGKTKYTFNMGTGHLTSADVRVSLSGTETQQVVVAIHELGHALGIHGHSDDTIDAMYYAVTPQTAIRERDLNTLYWLYSTSRAEKTPGGVVETRSINCVH